MRCKENTILQRIRLSKKLTQKQLAEKSETNLSKIRHIEAEETDIKNSALIDICRLAKALGVNIYDLIDDEELINLIKETT